jgi:predicted GNAT family acetyltransferase
MEICTYANPAQFLETAQPFLEQDEARNSLILGVTIRLCERPDWTDHLPYLATISGLGQPVLLAAAITPPQNLLLAAVPATPDEAVNLLVHNLQADGWPVPGVMAETALARQFVRLWAQATGAQARLKTRERIYRLDQVILPERPAPGRLRKAEPDDLALVSAWRLAFHREALQEDPPENYTEQVARLVAAGLIYVWDNDGPVSMLAKTRPTPRGISIGAVYTPPEQRGRGYASAAVAALSQKLLEEGRSFCTLYTDLDYPTSNAVYQRIGYRPIGDATEYRFS